jgi:hypothetical protein
MKTRVYNYNDSLPFNLTTTTTVFKGNIRYIVIDADTGEILDDANGEGYETSEIALTSYDPATRFAHLSEEEKQMRAKVHKWCMEHDELMQNMFDIEFDFFCKKEKMTEDDYEKYLQKYNLSVKDLPFSLEELKRFRN